MDIYRKDDAETDSFAVLQFKALVSEKPESGLECPFDIMLEIPREMEVLLDGIPNIDL